jgi:hypothetical protein
MARGYVPQWLRRLAIKSELEGVMAAALSPLVADWSSRTASRAEAIRQLIEDGLEANRLQHPRGS